MNRRPAQVRDFVFMPEMIAEDIGIAIFFAILYGSVRGCDPVAKRELNAAPGAAGGAPGGWRASQVFESEPGGHLQGLRKNAG